MEEAWLCGLVYTTIYDYDSEIFDGSIYASIDMFFLEFWVDGSYRAISVAVVGSKLQHIKNMSVRAKIQTSNL